MRALSFAAASVLCFAVAGCLTTPNPVSSGTIFAIESSYGIAQAAGIAYINLPLCPRAAPACHTQAGVNRLAAADRASRSALNAAEDFTRANPTLSPLTAIAAAQAALETFKSVEKSLGIQLPVGA